VDSGQFESARSRETPLQGFFVFVRLLAGKFTGRTLAGSAARVKAGNHGKPPPALRTGLRRYHAGQNGRVKMKRRTFLFRSLAALGQAGLAMPALAQSASGGRSGGNPSVTIAAAGDTVLGFNLQDHFDAQLALGRTREELFDLYFRGVSELLRKADLAVVNLECPFTERGEKLTKNFNFRARPELVEILRRGGVAAVSVANNHAMDFGVEGMRDTMQTLEAAGIGHFGTGNTLNDARQALILERNGLRLGFLGYYFQSTEDMLEPEQIYALADRPGVAGCYTDLPQFRDMVRQDVATLVKQVDVVIPFFHWGKEGKYVVGDYQREIAHLCIELGARAVLGAHPHRLHGVEVYQGAPIFYSLGNFVYGGIKNPDDTLTMVAQLRIDRERVQADVVPVRYTNWPDAPFQPVILAGADRSKAMARIAELSRDFPRTLPSLGTRR
jgi:poly-gamma-glutamate capsule biosynthesis protein CapA/YwtB (metallophosphatase superfamily)